MTTHHVVVIEINQDKISRSQWENIRKQNPKASEGAAVFCLAHLTGKATLKSLERNDFSVLRHKLKKKGKTLHKPLCRTTSCKITAYRYAEDLVETLRQSEVFVFYDNPVAHRVYIIRLENAAWKDGNKFARANGGKAGDWKEFLYVGETKLTVEERYEVHKRLVNGEKDENAASIVHQHGYEIAHDLMEEFQDQKYTIADALEKERDVALELRKRGYATWFN